MKALYWFIKFLFYSALFIAVIAVGGVYYIFWTYSKDLPKLDSLKDYHPPVVSEVFADDGMKIGEFWIERRLILEPNDIPKLIEQAIIASEDDRFFDHSGIDYIGIVRAMIENLKAGSIVQGGSTITQQVVKSFLLTKERTYERKIKEAILAKRIEDNFSKIEILYLYLNQTYFGNRAYGIESAAQNYFNKPAKELTIAEAAMIAGMAKAPTKFSPIKNLKRARGRQEYVIQRMYETGKISEEQMHRALAQPLKLYKTQTDKEYNLRFAPWFVEEVRRMIMKEYGDMVPYTRGLKIYTTVDLKAQHAAEVGLYRGLSELHKRHGYAGPLKTLSPAEYDAFNAENHRRIYLKQLEFNLYHRMTEEQIAAQQTTLLDDKIYEGLVTAVNKDSLTVRVGKVEGAILPKGFGWARKRSNGGGYYDNTGLYGPPPILVRNPSGTFHAGDVIEVKKVKNDSDPKTYAVDKTYFTLEQTPLVEGAIFSHDPWTGYVKAVVGGKNYEKSEFNRATQSIRQTGSVFKALLYAAALEKGYTPETTIVDAPICIPDGYKNWCPHNFGNKYSGAMSFRSALTHSVNLVSVRILMDIGTHYATGFIRNLGVTTPIAKVYSMALGSNDLKPMEVAHAIGAYPTGGILQPLIFIKKITDRFGNILEENHPVPVKNFADQIKDGDHVRLPDISYDETNIGEILRADLWTEGQKWIEHDNLNLSPQEKGMLYGKHIPAGYVITPKTAYTMIGIMRDIVDHGTAMRVKFLGRPVAGKTGTTNDLTDTWFVGYTPDLVASVWVGYDENKNKVGGGEQGGRTAAPIFLYYMQGATEGTPVKQFETPKEIDRPELKLPSRIQGYKQKMEFLEVPQDDRGRRSNGADFFLQDI